ncbi:germination protein YpeB [Ornithinibacillus gellani]|uniref:germination protein YpeB n=1 Tax=Ornithinibacillus gellani TaxID=2293253 RepID=UPI000F488A00|nr:germination protein YpeB [Ornithinibacillus gellani]TQS74430.1 germination protein YpeB [Ornithinibacillus gellani]
MFRWILISILSLAIAGTAFWGYKEHQEKNAILIQAENTYQRSFHELSYHMDMLHDKIGTTLAMNTKDRISPQLVEIWRLTSEAMSNVGQLPLTLLPFNKTEEFLSNIGNFTYRTAVRDLDQEPLSDQELKSLQNLYKQSGEIKSELRQVQKNVLENNLRWMDVQLALATADEQMDNTIIDGFKTVEKKVEGYAEANEKSNVLGTVSQTHSFKNLDEKKISKQEALKLGKSLLNKNTSQLQVVKSGKGADVPTYTISYEDDNKTAYVDVTEQGGHPLSLLVSREIGKQELSLHEGLVKAEDYIKKHNFTDMKLFRSSQYDTIGVYSFLHHQDGVRVYSDAIEIKVALDDGEILGMASRNFFMNHTKRDIPNPELSSDEAKDMVNPNVTIHEEYLSIIDNDLGEEVLTYEFLGTMGNDTYRIFINAMDGREEKVEKVSKSAANVAYTGILTRLIG